MEPPKKGKGDTTTPRGNDVPLRVEKRSLEPAHGRVVALDERSQSIELDAQCRGLGKMDFPAFGFSLRIAFVKATHPKEQCVLFGESSGQLRIGHGWRMKLRPFGKSPENQRSPPRFEHGGKHDSQIFDFHPPARADHHLVVVHIGRERSGSHGTELMAEAAQHVEIRRILAKPLLEMVREALRFAAFQLQFSNAGVNVPFKMDLETVVLDDLKHEDVPLS